MAFAINENDIKEFCKEFGYGTVKRAGIANTVKAYYMGIDLEFDEDADFDEVARELDMSRKEYNYWEDLFYKKDSWLNTTEE